MCIGSVCRRKLRAAPISLNSANSITICWVNYILHCCYLLIKIHQLFGRELQATHGLKDKIPLAVKDLLDKGVQAIYGIQGNGCLILTRLRKIEGMV